VISDSPEVALSLPNLIAFSVVTAGPTVDPYATAIDAGVKGHIAPTSLRALTRSLSRCRWFVTPIYWSAKKAYPGWSQAMQSWFLARYRLIPNPGVSEIWHRTSL
jgi:hypothetical protein